MQEAVVKFDKEYKKSLMKQQKEETLIKNAKLISEFRNDYENNLNRTCDIFNDDISVNICEDRYNKRKWTAYVHLTSSLPYRNSVGRQVKLFVVCSDSIIGMIHLTSAMAQLKLRDEYIGWSFEEKWTKKGINTIYNIQTCVPCRFQNLLTGKLLVYCVFSKNIKRYLTKSYNNPVKGIETTSLYGKSSMYNRIPFLKYLGTTEGNSAIYISDIVWKELLEEYYKYFPRTKTNRQAPVKYQIVDKLRNKYKQLNRPFMYEYKSAVFKRGVYYGTDFSKSIDSRIIEWKNRWLFPRAKRLGIKGV